MNSRRAAFTLIELLVVVVVVVILVGMLLQPAPRGKPNAFRIRCVNNLKNVGLAYQIYATDNSERFPWQDLDQKGEVRVRYLEDPISYIRTVTNELSTPKIVACPADTRKQATDWKEFSRENLSYFISADASEILPQSFMAGDRNITNRNGRLAAGLRVLSTTSVAGWDEAMHKNQGNACMGDGSVQQLSSARLCEQLRNTGQTNITLSIP